ncbi:lipopolysaccharide 1,6-galactosyltransferase [Leminorella grimontii]|uniref:Lipopolysaccharide 1,6-galactosyltransferase n=1 Tax=Leminorella grimontii TaxID=82981 RepID=A0AAV5N4Z2_9GAMM|nr:lipopolysaccharide 1,6-galactosyltransferase [Leminorella grimontii]KFC98459.1 lipopolysaccharide 1,6-galactosyltransferase [Leminorella grimontii ATCC 33999 = DSM 5078]GKX57195.1 lipopolysaccharide 1,6-galactosyltransferase [Leminorella grimontii]VFS56017.1 Probable poly(glycerol-phosphate) alpha-glucosyltransferase [Leminorella grimontii]
MKIAFVGEAVSGFGGMETVIRDVIHAFREAPLSAECKTFFFCRNDKMDKGWLEGIDSAYSFSNIKFSFLRRAKHISAFTSWLKQERPDVVICIDVLSCLLASKARSKAGQSFPLFSWPHFSLDHKKHAECVTYADYHLAISSGIKQQMMARGIPESAISVIYNPVSPKSVIIPAPEEGETPTFLYVGRMKFEGQKRIKDLLDGLSRVQGPWKLHVIGDGSDFERCQSYGRELNIDKRITWHGWQSHPWEVVQEDIQKVTALLLTSSFEGFPMTLLEAMSYGIPCVSADCMSGPRDIIQDGINGYLYAPGQVEKFSSILDGLIKGEKCIDRSSVQASILRFYNDSYYDGLNSAIFTSMKKSS